MTDKEIEKFGTLKAVMDAVASGLKLGDEDEDKKFLIESFHTFDGQNEYTLKFFPTDKDILALYEGADPSELDKSLDDLPNVPFRSWLECCCKLAWDRLNG